MVSSLLSFGLVGLNPSGVGATTVPKMIPLQKGNLKFHVSWSATVAGTSLSGSLGKFHIRGQITQPNPNTTSYVLKGLIDGLNLRAVLVEGANANAVTFTAKGSVGNRTLNVAGSIRTSSTGSLGFTFVGKIGATKLSGTFPLSTFTITSVSGVIRVS